MDKGKEERIEAYRKWLKDNLESESNGVGGYAEAEIVHEGVKYRIGQIAATPYDALYALALGLKFMQKELGIVFAPQSDGLQKPNNPQPTPSNGNGHNADTGTMPVEVIKLGQGGENPYWIVQGGSWKKHGVICWPEILEAAGFLDSLDPFKENRPQGDWTAVYKKKENGNPDKVVKFIPAN